MKKRWSELSAPVRYGIVTLAVGVGLILFWQLISAADDLWVSFRGVMGVVLNFSLPFIGALIISYALGPVVNWVEQILKRITRNRLPKPRIFSMIPVYLAVLSLAVWLVLDIVPELAEDLLAFADWVPNYLQQMRNYYEREILTQPYMENSLMQELAASLEQQLQGMSINIGSGMAEFLVRVLNGLPRVLMNLGLSLILSFYLVTGSRRIFSGISHFAFQRLGHERARRIFKLSGQLDRVFGRYISIKLLESLILFAIFEIVFYLIPLRYQTLMSLILAVTHLVPYLGPVTGSVIVILLAVLDSPALALWTAGTVVIIHLIDAWFIAPRLVGSHQGLHPFWVLAAVLIGGQLAGIPGMLLAVPVGAVVKIILNQKRKTKEETKP